MPIEWRRRPLFFAAILLSLGIAAWQFFKLPEFKSPQDISHILEPKPARFFLGGRVVSEVENRQVFGGDTKDYFILKTEQVWENTESPAKNVGGKVRVTWKNAPSDLAYGDVLVLEGELAPFKGQRNPGGFDSRTYWDLQGVRGAFFSEDDARHKVLSRGKGNPLKAGAIRLKHFFSQKISADFGDENAAFLKALFLGERQDLDQDFKDLFIKTGTMHLLAVSGFNIGFLSAVLWLFLKPLLIPRNWKLALLLASVWGYCFLVGWQAPMVRASVMATVFLVGSMIGRKSDGLNALGFAACVILGLNPKSLFDVGFQLSFVAVFGLITLSSVFVKKPKLLPNEKWTLKEKSFFAVEELFWVSFICYLATLPITVQNFYIVTPYALLANLFVVPLTFLLFFFGVPYFLCSLLLHGALFWATLPMKLVMAAAVKCLFLIENLPGSVCIVGKLETWLAVLLCAGIFTIFFEKRFETRRVRAIALILFCANIFLIQEVRREVFRPFRMTMLDVGQGDSIFFEFPQGGNLLVDAGGARFSDKGRWVLSPFLKSKGVRTLDAVVLSHPQEDHVGGLETVLKEFRVKRVYHAGFAYDSPRWHKIEDEIRQERAVVEKLGRGLEISGYPEVKVAALHPELESQADPNINNESVILKLTYGSHSFLMTGDIEEKAMESLLASGQDLRADVLKVPHHGAKVKETGRAFFGAVAPAFSLISSGERNPFGHPSPAALEALGAVPGNLILRTDEEGAIALVSDGHRIVIDSKDTLGI